MPFKLLITILNEKTNQLLNPFNTNARALTPNELFGSALLENAAHNLCRFFIGGKKCFDGKF